MIMFIIDHRAILMFQCVTITALGAYFDLLHRTCSTACSTLSAAIKPRPSTSICSRRPPFTGRDSDLDLLDKEFNTTKNDNPNCSLSMEYQVLGSHSSQYLIIMY